MGAIQLKLFEQSKKFWDKHKSGFAQFKLKKTASIVTLNPYRLDKTYGNFFKEVMLSKIEIG